MDFNFADADICRSELKPYFEILIPNFIKNDYALIGGIIAGLANAAYNIDQALLISKKINSLIKKLFSVISFLIPLFIVGFIVKCASDKTLTMILKNYSQVFLIFVTYAFTYTFLIYLAVNKFVLSKCFSCLKNMMPALFTAISTMSSALTMPVTMLSSEKNVENKELSGSVISATVNIHLLGDCIAIPMLAYVLLKNYGIEEPSLYTYFVFAIFFVIAKFSVAAVPAGGIIVMAPVLEQYLGFTSEMVSVIITIYIIFDPIITGFNVLGNGAFAKLIDNISQKTTSRSTV
jgi:Na+/H+-dicarboxylate symporter